MHEVASASDLGRRLRRNEDAVAVFALSLPQDDLDIVVLAVADGLGEHARGSNASVVAVEAFGDALSGLVGSLLIGPRWQFGLAEIVETAIAETNAKVRAMKPNAKGQPAATTLTAAVLAGDWLCAAHVGNSRVYRLSGNELEQLTEDHAREPLALLTPPREDMLTVNDTRATRVGAGCHRGHHAGRAVPAHRTGRRGAGVQRRAARAGGGRRDRPPAQRVRAARGDRGEPGLGGERPRG